MKTVYYAHSKLLYDTQEEKAQSSFIKKTFGNVLCPNKDIGELGAMKPYLDIIKKKCTHVVCSEFFGLVGKGVWEEVKTARKLKLPTYCVRKINERYILCKIIKGKVVDPDNWRSYAELVCEPIKERVK